MNENQNVFIEGNRTTSRVTNEPGGKSSVQLGWDSPKSEPKRNQKAQEKENNLMQVVGSATASKPNADVAKAKGTPKRVGVGGRDRASSQSSNAYASGSSQNTGNVITDRPTSRVTQPPGGKSSISFY